MSGALTGVRVLDLSRVLAGPWCTQLLADFGADVLKIEKPGRGDDTRQWGPPFLQAANGEAVAAYFLAANRGKRSLAIDIKSAPGQDLLRRLVLQCDIVVENFKPGTLARYGLDYASLARAQPRLVYCSITGFGQHGPNAQRPGYDLLIQAEAGLMSVTGQPDGQAGAGPLKCGVAVADLMCGMYASSAILAALRHRDTTGVGQHLDIALFDTQLAWLANLGLEYLVSGLAPQRLGNAHPSIVPYQAFATADGHIVLAVGNDAQFAAACRVLGDASLAQQARFADNAARVRHRAELVALLAQRLAARPSAEWLPAFAQAGVPAGPINGVDQAFAHNQVAARELALHLEHPALGSIPQVANPIKFSATPIAYTRAPPRLGEHTASVLTELLGLGTEDIETLRASGAIA